MELKNHPLVKQLFSLKLPPKDYVIFGSGPMFARGIRPLEQLDDLDLVPLTKVLHWKKKMGRPKDLRHVEMIKRYLNE